MGQLAWIVALPLGAAVTLTRTPLGAVPAIQELAEERAPKHPHVVVIVLDDVGYGDLKPWAKNNTIIRTPNMDRLASAGMILDRHYTQATCTPTRAAFLTGRYPIRYGLQTGPVVPSLPFGLALNETTIAQIFKKGGYATHMVGKWHLGFHTWAATPTFRGFDTWFGISEGESDHVNYTFHYQTLGHDVVLGTLFEQRRPNCGLGCMVKVERHEYSTSLWTEHAVRTVEDHNLSVPLFLYLCYTAPHAPCERPHEPYRGIYPDVEDPKRRVYAEVLSAIDGGIGEVTAALSKRGMLNDTLLVVFSDNGGPVGAPGGHVEKRFSSVCEPFGKWGANTGASNYPFRGGKHTAFEGGVRTPAFIHYPRYIKAGSRFAGLAHVSDWLPTILAAASVNDADRAAFPLDGVNLWPALRANGPSPRMELLVGVDAEAEGAGGALIRNWTKLFVGPIFNSFNFWALPPEVALAHNVQLQDDPIVAPPMRCSQGCVFDLQADPREEHPRNATAEDKDLVDAYMAYKRAAAPSLSTHTLLDPRSLVVYKLFHSTWPYS